MKQFFVGVGLALCVMSASGCAAQIKYNFDKDLFVSQAPKDRSVVIDVFQDNRSEKEKIGEVYGKSGYAVSEDKLFKKDVPLQISNMLAEHLTKAKVFNKAEVVDVSNDLELKSAEMIELRTKGYGLAVVGKLNHFYGYYSDEVSAAMSAMFGLVGVLTEAMVNPKKVGGKVEYGDVKIIDLGNGAVVWSGNVEHSFENEVKFYDSTVAYVLKALKETNDKFSKQLSGTVL